MISPIPFVSAALGSDPDAVRTDYWTTPEGDRARLRLGDHLSLAVATASPEALRQLAICAEELADWRDQQDTRQAVAS